MGKEAESRLGHILAVIAALSYALQVVLGKFFIQMGVEPKDLLVPQYSGATVILFVLLFFHRKKVGGMRLERKYHFPIVLQGAIGCCGTSFFLYLALDSVNAGICSMLLYLCPVYVCLFFIITGLRKITFINKIAMMIAFIGAIFVLNLIGLTDMRWSVKGLIFGVLAGLCYAFYGIYSDLKLKSIPVEKMLFYMYLIATITIWLLNPDFAVNPIHIEGAKMWVLISFVVILQVLPMALLNIAIRMIGANRATIIATAELPFTVILAFFILKEQMVFIQVIGILMITVAVVLLNIKK